MWGLYFSQGYLSESELKNVTGVQTLILHSAVQHFNHYTTVTPPKTAFGMVRDVSFFFMIFCILSCYKVSTLHCPLQFISKMEHFTCSTLNHHLIPSMFLLVTILYIYMYFILVNKISYTINNDVNVCSWY